MVLFQVTNNYYIKEFLAVTSPINHLLLYKVQRNLCLIANLLSIYRLKMYIRQMNFTVFVHHTFCPGSKPGLFFLHFYGKTLQLSQYYKAPYNVFYQFKNNLIIFS